MNPTIVTRSADIRRPVKGNPYSGTSLEAAAHDLDDRKAVDCLDTLMQKRGTYSLHCEKCKCVGAVLWGSTTTARVAGLGHCLALAEARGHEFASTVRFNDEFHCHTTSDCFQSATSNDWTMYKKTDATAPVPDAYSLRKSAGQCCRRQEIALLQHPSLTSPSECERYCDSNPNCLFFDHSQAQKSCAICDHCDDDYSEEPDALSWTSWEKYDDAWFVYCSLHLPHSPWHTNATWLAGVHDEKIPRPFWPDVASMHPYDSYMTINKNIHESYSDSEILQIQKAYLGCNQQADHLFGWLIDEARRVTNGLENTYIIFVSDHGEMGMQHRQTYKNSMYESSARVPLIVAGPKMGIPEGHTRQHVVSLNDVLPTLAEMIGINVEREFLDGHSLFDQIHFRQSARPDYILSQYHANLGNTGSFMVRRGDYKYIKFGTVLSTYENYTPMLFNVRTDPEERENIWSAHSAVAQEMDEILEREWGDVNRIDLTAKVDQYRTFLQFFGDLGPTDVYNELRSLYRGMDANDFAKITAWRTEMEQLIAGIPTQRPTIRTLHPTIKVSLPSPPLSNPPPTPSPTSTPIPVDTGLWMFWPMAKCSGVGLDSGVVMESLAMCRLRALGLGHPWLTWRPEEQRCATRDDRACSLAPADAAWELHYRVHALGAELTARPTTRQPTREPTARPTGRPSDPPSHEPSASPSAQPSPYPTRRPTPRPSVLGVKYNPFTELGQKCQGVSAAVSTVGTDFEVSALSECKAKAEERGVMYLSYRSDGQCNVADTCTPGNGANWRVYKRTPQCGDGVCNAGAPDFEDQACWGDCRGEMSAHICACAQAAGLCDATCGALAAHPDQQCAALEASNYCAASLFTPATTYRDFCGENYCPESAYQLHSADQRCQGAKFASGGGSRFGTDYAEFVDSLEWCIYQAQVGQLISFFPGKQCNIMDPGECTSVLATAGWSLYERTRPEMRIPTGAPTSPLSLRWLPVFTWNRKCVGVAWDNSTDGTDVNVGPGLDGLIACQELAEAGLDNHGNIVEVGNYMSFNDYGTGIGHCNFAASCQRGYGTGWNIYMRRFMLVAVESRCQGARVNGQSDNHAPDTGDYRDFQVSQDTPTMTGEEICQTRAAFSESRFFSYRFGNCNVRTAEEGCSKTVGEKWTLWAMYPEEVQNL